MFIPICPIHLMVCITYPIDDWRELLHANRCLYNNLLFHIQFLKKAAPCKHPQARYATKANACRDYCCPSFAKPTPRAIVLWVCFIWSLSFSCADTQDAQEIYKSKLFGSVRNWRKPMVTIPSSFRRSRMSSLTITIFLKLSSSALSGRSS